MLRLRPEFIYPVLAAALAIPLLVGADPEKKGPEGHPGRGKRLFRTTAACSGCHVAEGRGGKLGPDLNHIGSKHDAEYIAAKIYNPKLGKPDSMMPAADTLGLEDHDVADIAAYLAGLK
jgi:mono/diheme cytochrome c family protein